MRRAHRLPTSAAGGGAAAHRSRRCRRYCSPAAGSACRVVARGSGTGLSGGATPHPQGVLLSLSRMNRILEIDPPARTARLQPGVPQPARLGGRGGATASTTPRIPPRRSPAPSAATWRRTPAACTASSTGSPCTTCWACAATASTGSASSWAAARADGPGLDLLALTIGSEGLLMVVTEVIVKLDPAAAVCAARDGLLRRRAQRRRRGRRRDRRGHHPGGAGDDGPQGHRGRRALRARRLRPRGGRDPAGRVGRHAPRRSPTRWRRSNACCAPPAPARCAVSGSEAERLRLWSGRKNAFPAAGRISPDYYCMDGTIPRKHVGRVLEAIEHMEAALRSCAA